MDEFMKELQTKENKIVMFDGPELYPIKIVHHNGNVYLSFLNSDGEECIGVDYYNNKTLTLGNYYFNTPIDCVRVPNDWFFMSFLTPLAEALGAHRIILNDASSKTFESCTVPMIFFVLAGKGTFYNHYGFRNKVFEDYVEKLKRKKLRGLTDLDIRNSAGVLSSGKPIPFKMMDQLILHGMLDKPIPEVAQFVLNTCKRTSSKRDIALANTIIHLFKLKVIVENQFEKPMGGKRKTRRKRKRN